VPGDGDVRFLDGPTAKTAIRELLPKAERIRVAVAYWGAGAVDQLAIADLHGRDMIVLCDVMSAGCNPKEIKRLQKILGKQRVLTRNRLHAKVWLTDRGAILGSSNASANGLGHEGDETKGLVEANILIEDRSALTSIERWFEDTASLEPVAQSKILPTYINI
jgi:phosphatidylserine/phosphatidylglycerophosphate/cardiolipin synthase-like enzyme